MEITYGTDERAKPRGRIALRTNDSSRRIITNDDKMLKQLRLKGNIKLGIYNIIIILSAKKKKITKYE